MAEPQTVKIPSLAEDYSLEKDEKPEMGSKPEEVEKVESPVKAANEEEKETPTSTVAESAPVEESTEVNSASVEDRTEAAPAATEESSDAAEEENSGDQEDAGEAPEIKLETAPADFRFPTTNQTRHCFTRYIEYHRCVAAKGEDATECDKFAKYYRSLCPTEWVERWNEQRANGTFPGPL